MLLSFNVSFVHFFSFLFFFYLIAEWRLRGTIKKTEHLIHWVRISKETNSIPNNNHNNRESIVFLFLGDDDQPTHSTVPHREKHRRRQSQIYRKQLNRQYKWNETVWIELVKREKKKTVAENFQSVKYVEKFHKMHVIIVWTIHQTYLYRRVYCLIFKC